MNSLNILSARVSPPQTPSPSRNSSFADVLSATISEKRRNSRAEGLDNEKLAHDIVAEDPSNDSDYSFRADEKSPLLDKGDAPDSSSRTSGWYLVPNRIANALLESLRWLLSTIAAPGIYLIGYLYNEQGQFAPLSQLGLRKRKPVNPVAQPSDSGLVARAPGKSPSRRNSGRLNKSPPVASSSSSSGLSSDSESERDPSHTPQRDIDSPARHTRSKSSSSADEITPARRSIRIKLHNEDSLRQRKHRKAQSTSSQSSGSGPNSSSISPATLKSPTSPASSLLMTKYPRAPTPPRPLLPRRQPSYSHITDTMAGGLTQKTLILDLDETLIHSMAKGGRMSTGHMVEVKLNTYIGLGGNANAGTQHPILYYVHKRPHCDDFLRRVCKWYNLVVFTASVQEYADPVIDWLEQERKFFSGRYYRQHCTYRHGAFIKDLTSVEPDLSKVMILDNSPLSYMFHQDNAIPIEGWINDPTDNDLLHLMPLLEGLQYVTDVRALLALRGGEDGKHTLG